jgi:nicotinamidase-related amidase
MTKSTALIVIDMLNRYEHEDADTLIESAREMLPVMQALLGYAQDYDVPVVFVNDNYGDWSAGPRELCERALHGPQRALVEPVLPPFRPRRSACSGVSFAGRSYR